MNFAQNQTPPFVVSPYKFSRPLAVGCAFMFWTLKPPLLADAPPDQLQSSVFRPTTSAGFPTWGCRLDDGFPPTGSSKFQLPANTILRVGGEHPSMQRPPCTALAPVLRDAMAYARSSCCDFSHQRHDRLHDHFADPQQGDQPTFPCTAGFRPLFCQRPAFL